MICLVSLVVVLSSVHIFLRRIDAVLLLLLQMIHASIILVCKMFGLWRICRIFLGYQTEFLEYGYLALAVVRIIAAGHHL